MLALYRADMHITPNDKGKPTERWGRKATGLRAQAYGSGVTEYDASAASELGRSSAPGPVPSRPLNPLLSLPSVQASAARRAPSRSGVPDEFGGHATVDSKGAGAGQDLLDPELKYISLQYLRHYSIFRCQAAEPKGNSSDVREEAPTAHRA